MPNRCDRARKRDFIYFIVVLMTHKLYMSMYAFQVKQNYRPHSETKTMNDFLSHAYPDEKGSKFGCFVKDIVELIEEKVFKNASNTHGGVLEEKAFSTHKRTLDLMINGGTTGIKHYLISEDGKKRETSDTDIVGLKFFVRIWLPANSKVGFVFMQTYNSLGIRPLIDSIIETVLRNYNHKFAGSGMVKATTKKRQKEFLKNSHIKDIIVISNSEMHGTGVGKLTTVEIKIKNVLWGANKEIDLDDISSELEPHGFKIDDRKYIIKGRLQKEGPSKSEEKTVYLDQNQDSINVIPNVQLPGDCQDVYMHPLFDKIREWVDVEMAQLQKEARK